jgi:hypothetical protein
MTMPVGIQTFGGLGGSIAALNGLQAQLDGVTAANHAVATAITPPGSEGASSLAVAKQMMNVEHFGSMFAMGLEQMHELFAVMAMDGAAVMATDAASAGTFV